MEIEQQRVQESGAAANGWFLGRQPAKKYST